MGRWVVGRGTDAMGLSTSPGWWHGRILVGVTIVRSNRRIDDSPPSMAMVAGNGGEKGTLGQWSGNRQPATQGGEERGAMGYESGN